MPDEFRSPHLQIRRSTGNRAAEAGVQRTMNWMLNSYTVPTTFTSYDMTKNPVWCNDAVKCANNHQPVVLSATGLLPAVTANYPDATVKNAYSAALSNQAMPG